MKFRVRLDTAYFTETKNWKLKIIKRLLFIGLNILFMSHKQCKRRWFKKKKKRQTQELDANTGNPNTHLEGVWIEIIILTFAFFFFFFFNPTPLTLLMSYEQISQMHNDFHQWTVTWFFFFFFFFSFQ